MNLRSQAAAVSTRLLLDSLQLAKAGEGRFHAHNMPTAHSVVFGGQLLAQSVVAALAGENDMTVKTLHTVFASPGDPAAPLEIDVERVRGDLAASATVTIQQGGQVRSRSMALLSTNEPDFIRHADQRALPPDPGVEFDDNPQYRGRYQLDIAGGVDIADPDAVGPAELELWTRFDGAPDDLTTSQALLAYSSMALFVATAMRPHEGVGMALLERTVSASVLSHTVTFHEPAPAAEWLLMVQRSPYAGGGHSYGRADVFREDGQLVASVVQDNAIRPLQDPVSARATA
jgi:acyl-CoA thioesterase-2